jgi:hypothetical protein
MHIQDMRKVEDMNSTAEDIQDMRKVEDKNIQDMLDNKVDKDMRKVEDMNKLDMVDIQDMIVQADFEEDYEELSHLNLKIQQSAFPEKKHWHLQ